MNLFDSLGRKGAGRREADVPGPSPPPDSAVGGGGQQHSLKPLHTIRKEEGGDGRRECFLSAFDFVSSSGTPAGRGLGFVVWREQTSSQTAMRLLEEFRGLVQWPCTNTGAIIMPFSHHEPCQLVLSVP